MIYSALCVHVQIGDNLVVSGKCHLPGEFLTSKDVRSIEIGTSEKIEMDLEHQIDSVLVLGGEKCNPDLSYNRDACFQTMVFNQSMEEYGCTTPWGPNKDHICTNETIGREAHRLYKEFFIWRNATKALENCPKSCTIMKLRTANEKYGLQAYIKGKRTASLHIRLYETITVTEDQYIYIWLNLVAEIGGYVGLFLGYSVYQITDLIEMAFLKNQ